MIIKKFEEQVERSPNEIAVKGRNKTLTYGELNRCANRISHEIMTVNRVNKNGLTQGVALLFEHGSDMIVGIISTLKAERLYVPFDVTYPLNRLGYMLENSDSSLILTNNNYFPLAEQLITQIHRNVAILNIDNTSSENPVTNRKREASGERPAYILYTSGSTGRPKGVVQTHRNVLYYIRNWVQRFSITASDRMTLFSAFTHDGAVQDMFAALLTGACLYPYSIKIDSNPHGIYILLNEEKITIWHSVPSLFRYFAGTLTKEDRFNDIRWVLLGGEPIRPFDLELFKPYFPAATLANVYGQTESSVSSICMLTLEDTFDDVSIGEPLNETEIFLVDKDGDIVEEMGMGEIVVASDYIAAGYWQDEKTSEEVFLHDDELGRLYMTGDLGRLTGRGTIKMMGRKDHQVKIRGFRVETGEIETSLLQIEGIREAAVVPKETGTEDTYLCAFIVAGKKMKLAELREFLSRELPDYMIPTSFVQLEAMPFTQSGKLDKKALMNLEKEPMQLEETYTPPQTDMEKIVADTWQEVLGLEKVGINDNFFDLGGNSFDILKINNTLTALLKRDIPIVKLFEHSTINTLANYLKQQEVNEYPIEEKGDSARRCQEREENRSEVAVIGMSGRFPGARSIDEFWENLKNGVESISFFSDEELRDMGIAEDLLSQPAYVKAKGVLENIEFFDASFFNFTPREAEVTDPQTRIFFECVWDALENAGYNPYDYNGSIGLYAGNIPSFYGVEKTFLNRENNSVGQFEATLFNQSFSAKLAYKLNLKGPCVSIRTACSTSLVTIHTACRGLWGRECHIALAGGASISLPKKSGYLYQEGMLFSADGHVRAFDARAKGTIFGDGLGCVVLKRLDDAIADGDCIYAVVIGTAINNDGYRKIGFTAPSIEGQADVIKAAHLMAGIEPESISFIEAHGTGTVLGDPVEIEALKKVFFKNKKNSLAIGSVKGNIGHLNAAAGVAGFIKTVLMLKAKLISPSLHFETLNLEIDLENSPFYINRQLKEWKADYYPLRTGVSSFGLGGTNAHVILEEAPRIRQREPLMEKTERAYRLLVLSAKEEAVLEQITQNLLDHFKKKPDTNLADTAYTLQVGRGHFKYRRWLVCSTVEEAIDALSNQDKQRVHTGIFTNENRPVIFMFSGLGSQYVNMGLELYRKEPVFQLEMDRCFEILKSLMNHDLKEILYPMDSTTSTLETFTSPANLQPNINQPELSQPIMFIFEYALAVLLMKWGIKPQAMIGYSFGEYVAACISGVFSLEDALRLVVYRSKLIQKMPPGAMLSIPLPATEVTSFLNNELSVAIDNGPSCIVAGSEDAVSSLEKSMKERKIICVRVPSSRALHSHMMEPILKEFEKIIAQFTLNSPKIPFITNVTGTWSNNEEVAKPLYWAKHLTHTVQFATGMKELVKEDKAVFIEIGPGQDLGTLALRYFEKNSQQQVINLIRHPNKNESDVFFLLNKIGKLWLYGVKPHWFQLYEEEKRFRIPLPTYPYRRQRYWIDQELSKIDIALNSEVSQPNKKDNLFYVPSWKPSGLSPYPPENSSPDFGTCRLMFIDESNFTSQLVKQLRNQGDMVFCVKAGTKFKKIDEFNYIINSSTSEHYDRLLWDLRTMDLKIHSIDHLWSITNICNRDIEFKYVMDALEMGLYTLLHLARAIENQRPNEAKPIPIKVITNNIHRLPGEEVIYPEKSTILAAIKLIPLQYPHIKVNNIDISLPPPGTWQEERLAKQLEVELKQEYAEEVIVYRGHDRLILTYEPLESEKNGEIKSQLKNGGVYLITGGLEGIGLEFAQYISRTSKSKLILIENPGSNLNSRNQQLLPLENNNKDEALVPLSEKFDNKERFWLNINEEIVFMQEVEEKIRKDLRLKESIIVEGKESTFNRLCSSYILDYLKKSGIDIEPGTSYKREDLKTMLKISQKYNKFYNFFIQVLSEDQLLREENGNIEFSGDSALVKNPRLLSEEAQEQYPEFSGTLKLLEYCTSHYSNILSGDIPAVTVLYPGGNYIKFEEKYTDLVQNRTEELYILLLRELISEIIEKAPLGRTVKILEIGAGQGLLTNSIIPVLLNRDVEYHFTDIGNFFVINAKKKADQQGLKFMRFGKFDISKDPTEEGYDGYSFDIIIGLNVVHMVKYIEEAIKNLKKLLVPNGVIALIEITEPKRWNHLINGLAEGWWHFEDTDLRKESSLLSLPTWEEVFKKLGFNNVYSLPLAEQKKLETNCGLIVAQQLIPNKDQYSSNKIHVNPESTNDKIRNIAYLKKQCAEIHVMEADKSNLEEMKNIILQAEKKFGKINGVIHCPWVKAKQGKARENSPEQLSRILKPGIKTILVLDKIFKNQQLDFYLIHSVMNLVDPSQETIENCALVNFYNSFAHYKQYREGQSLVSINRMYYEGEICPDLLFPYPGYSFPNLVVASRKLMELPKKYDISPEQFYNESDSIETVQTQPTDSKYSRSGLNSEYEPPIDKIQRALVELWEEFLGIKPIGISDNFFELGNDSLIFITLAPKIHQLLNVNIPIPEFFNHPTIKELTRYIGGAKEKTFSSIEKVEEKDYFGLSSAQMRLYLLHRMEPESIGYNIPLILQVKGLIDKEKSDRILKELILRHETLRTSFLVIDDTPIQVIHRHVDFKIEYSHLEEDKKAQGIPGIIMNFIRPFALSTPPLLRMKLIKKEEQKHILLVDMHHIIADGLSLNIFMREFSTLYEGKGLTPLRFQYKDYAHWQERQKETEIMRRQEKYWLTRFPVDAEIPVLDLPTDFPRSGIKSFEGGRLTFNLTPNENQQLKNLAASEGTTLFILLLTVFYVFLSKLTNQEAIVVGTVTAGRRHSDLQPLIGMFVNTLGLINYPDNKKTFDQFLKDVIIATLDDFENQDYPFDELLKKIPINRDASRNPLFDVMFAFERFEREKVEISSLKLSQYAIMNQITWFDLTLSVFESEESISFTYEYSTKLFKKCTIERFSDYYKKILSVILNNRNIILEEIEINHGYNDIEVTIFGDDRDDFESLFLD